MLFFTNKVLSVYIIYPVFLLELMIIVKLVYAVSCNIQTPEMF